MNIASKLAIAGVLGATILGGVAFAHNWRGGPTAGPGYFGGHHGAHLLDRLQEELDLTDAQEAKLDGAMEQLHRFRRDVRRQRRDGREQLLGLLGSPTLDQNSALEVVRQNVGILERRAPEVIAAIASFTDTLRADQKQQIRDWLAHRMRGKAGRWQR